MAFREWRAYVVAALLGGLGGIWLGGMLQEPGLEERLRTAELNLIEQQRRQAGVEQYAKMSEDWHALTQEDEGSADQRSRACKGYGDCLFLGTQYELACAAYREALRWDGGNEGARLNLCLAMERLPQTAQPPSPQQPPASKGQNPQQPPQQPPNDQGKQPPNDQGKQPPQQPPDEPGKQPPGKQGQPPAGQDKQPGSTEERNGEAKQPRPGPSAAPNSGRQLLRHLVEQERDRSNQHIDNRDLKPPRGTETW